MTPNTDITSLTLAEVSARIHAREVSCEEVTRALLERIDRLEPAINGYVLVHREHAMAQARAADALLGAGVDHGPLHGVPIAIKDLYRGARHPVIGGLQHSCRLETGRGLDGCPQAAAGRRNHHRPRQHG